MDNLAYQFANCWRRLHWAYESLSSLPTTSESLPSLPATSLRVIPGAGISEAACIRKLEEIATGRQSLQDNVDTSHTNLPLYFTSSWVNNQFIMNENQWKEAVYRSFANGLRKYLMRCILNSKPGLSFFEAWGEAERKIQGGREGGEGAGDVLDVATSKREAWHGAVHLLEIIFLSKRVQVR